MRLKKMCRWGLFLSGLISSAAILASPCDNMPITVVGYENYKYSLILGKGSFGNKGSKLMAVYQKLTSNDAAVYRVFSAKGTKGDVIGEIVFTDPESNHSISLPFTLYKSVSCVAKLPITNASLGKAHIQAQSATNVGITFTINENK